MNRDDITSQLDQRRLRASALEEEENHLHMTFADELLKLKGSVESLKDELRTAAEYSKETIAQLQTQVDVLKRQNAALLDQTHYLQCQLDRQFSRTKFSHLPVEIRVMIWKLAAGESPKVYKVHTRDTPLRKRDGVVFHFTMQCPRQPSVTQVCRESRAALLPKRQREIVSPHRELESNQQVVPDSAGISIIWEGILTWFDPVKDVVLLPAGLVMESDLERIDLADILSSALKNLQERVGPLKHVIFPGFDWYMMRNLFHICRNLHGLDSIDICLEQGTMPCHYRTAAMTLLGNPFPSAVCFGDDRLIDIEETIRADSSKTIPWYGKAGQIIELFDNLGNCDYEFTLLVSHLKDKWLVRPVDLDFNWQGFEQKFPMAWATHRLAPVQQVPEFDFDNPLPLGDPFSEEEVRRLKQEARRAPRLKRVVVFE